MTVLAVLSGSAIRAICTVSSIGTICSIRTICTVSAVSTIRAVCSIRTRSSICPGTAWKTICTIFAVSSISAVFTVAAVVYCYGKILRKIYGVSGLLAVLHQRPDVGNKIIILKRCDDFLQSRNIGIQSINHILQILKGLPCRQLYLLSASECQHHRILIGSIYVQEERISILAILRCCLIQLLPCGAIVIGQAPESVLDLQHRRNSILAVNTCSTIRSIRARKAWKSRKTVGTIRTVSCILAVDWNPVALTVENPLPVKHPAIDTVSILPDTDHRHMAVSARGTVRTVRTVRSIRAVRSI